MATDIDKLIDGALEPPASQPAPTPEPEPAATPDESPYAAYATQLRPPVSRSDSGRWLDHHLLTVLAIALALPALRAPVAWLLLCAVASVLMLGVDAARTPTRGPKGSADVVVVPSRVAARIGLGFVNPVNWLTVVLGGALALLVGALTAGAISALRWLAVEGPDGILAAVRMGAWAHAPTYGAVVACFFLLRAGGVTADHRAVTLGRATRRLSEIALTGAVVGVVVLCVAFAVSGPRLGVGFVRDADGLGWVPPGLRSLADDGRDDLVTAELDALTSCLATGQPDLWTARATTGRPLDEVDVATLVADPARPPAEPALAAAALAADNHLAPWVEVLEIAVGDQVVLTVDRRGATADQPRTDAAALRPRAVGAPEWLATAAPQVDRALVLECSARTPF